MAKYDLPRTYEFKAVEKKIYARWEEGGYFKPSNDPRQPGFDPSIKPFVISIPPPNVTGELHLGHVMFVAMEDLMIRHQRMKGRPVLWLPGTDHAGIATQLQVEKMLARQGTSREAVGRQEFERLTWEWKEEYGGMITGQIRSLGASCDWSRQRFTLDEGLSKAVREAFVRLYEKGLIYRGPRLINWSPGLKTAVSDLEVEYSEEEATLYYFKYMLADSEEFIPVATIRPETILGDTAVAVHPQDERYKKFIGRKALVPVLNRSVPVIADEYVTPEFGTGALKVTPGHDPADYEIGARHNLETISILDTAARINENGGPYAGLDRFECRERLWADMQAAGLVIKTEPYRTTIPRSQRGGEIVEPMISTQWFVRIEPLARAALQAVRDGRIRIIPERFEKVYYNWLSNIKDWCISRQLWWGHRIPVWYCRACGKQTVTRQDPQACSHCGSADIHQEEDVLDTWFSSGLWPFSTLGWPDDTPDYAYFYPTTLMETGYDILFFWVARMIMMGLEFTGSVPFEMVYLHGLVRDTDGRKMSKSFGNVIDPAPVIAAMGTDALRFTLLVGSAPGNDVNLNLKKVEANRNFANKLWNAGRLVAASISQAPEKAQAGPEWTLADSHIWARLKELTCDVERLFASHQYGEAGRQIHEFFWSEFADWYLEVAKLQLAHGGDRAYYTARVMLQVMDICLRLLHPFTPFVTEELWGHLKQAARQHSDGMKPFSGSWEPMLICARWPEAMPAEGWEQERIASFRTIQEIVRSIRNLRAGKKVKPALRIPAVFAGGPAAARLLESELPTVAALAGLDAGRCIIFNTDKDTFERPQDHIALVAGPVEIYVPLTGLIDPGVERQRLEKELESALAQVDRLAGLLAGDFSSRAPAAVVQKEREKLDAGRQLVEKLERQIRAIQED